MFGAIRRYRDSMGADERTQLGEKLAARLSDLPGFIACVVLEEAGGECVSIELFEERSGLLAAETVLACAPFTDGSTTTFSGEAIFQKGL